MTGQTADSVAADIAELEARQKQVGLKCRLNKQHDFLGAEKQTNGTAESSATTWATLWALQAGFPRVCIAYDATYAEHIANATATPTTRCAGTAVASPHHSHHRRRRIACQRGVVVGEERRRTRRQIRFLWFRLCGWRWRRISTFSRGNNGTLSRLSVCSIMILPSPLVLSDGEATIVGLVRRGKACSGQWIEPLLPLHPKIKVVVYPIMLLPHHEEKNEA